MFSYQMLASLSNMEIMKILGESFVLARWLRLRSRMRRRCGCCRALREYFSARCLGIKVEASTASKQMMKGRRERMIRAELLLTTAKEETGSRNETSELQSWGKLCIL